MSVYISTVHQSDAFSPCFSLFLARSALLLLWLFLLEIINNRNSLLFGLVQCENHSRVYNVDVVSVVGFYNLKPFKLLDERKKTLFFSH